MTISKKSKIVLCLMGTVILESHNLLAMDDFDLMLEKIRIERAINERVLPLFRKYDPQPVVNVTVTFEQRPSSFLKKRKEEAPLPGTPFTFNNFKIEGDREERPHLKKIDIHFYGDSTLYPDNMSQLVRQLMSDYRIKPRVQFKTLPVAKAKLKPLPVQLRNTLWSYEKAFEDRLRPFLQGFDSQSTLNVSISLKGSQDSIQEAWTVLSAQDFFKRIEKVKITVATRFKDVPPYVKNFFRASFKEMDIVPAIEAIQIPDQNPPLPQQNSWPYVFGMFSTFLIFMAWWGRSFAKGQGKVLAEKLGPLREGKPVEAEAEERSLPVMTLPMLANSVPGGSGGWKGTEALSLPLVGLEALLNDCYWCELDGYAHFIWKRVPLEEKTKLLKQNPHFEDYVANFFNLEEVDLGKDQDPSYLNPLPISHLDNVEVAKLVQGHPPMLKKLSMLRKEHLPIPIPELLALMGDADMKRPERKDFDYMTIKGPTLRTFGVKIGKTIQSVEEEEKIIAIPHLGLDMKRGIPSLAWLLDLYPDERKELLASFSARKLAECWVGPEYVLRELSMDLPKKKEELLRSYLNKVVPNRNSPYYLELHELVMRKLSGRTVIKREVASERMASNN